MTAKFWLYFLFIEKMIATATPSSVMSIDLGHEFFKIAVISVSSRDFLNVLPLAFFKDLNKYIFLL